MNTTIGTREEWLAARKELLEAEKELTRRNDELAERRRELPRVRVDKTYEFDTHEGTKTLAELFDGRSQLIVYHFMHGPNTPEGCRGCTFATDSFDGTVKHLNAHDVTFLLASRSPLEVLDAYKERMGWDIPLGLLGPHGLQPRLQRLDRGGPRERHRLQFRLTGRSRRRRGPRRGAHGAERLRARGRGRLPHVYVLRPRH